MAAKNNLKFYPDITKTEYFETLQKNVQEFNTTANPYVQFSVRDRNGDIQKNTFLKKPSDTVYRADRSDESEATAEGIDEGELKHPRIEGRTRRYTMGRLELKRAEMTAEEYSGAIGQWSATGQQEDYVESGVSALVGLLSSVSDINYDHGANKADFDALLSGIRTHGDKADDIGIWVMPSGAYFDLVKDNYDSGHDSLIGLSAIQGSAATLGKPVLKADLDALYETDSNGDVTGYRILGLRTGALEIVDIAQMQFEADRAQTNAGNRDTMMGDYAYDLKLRGGDFADIDDPTVDQLIDANNWSFNHSDVKDSPGCLVTVSN